MGSPSSRWAASCMWRMLVSFAPGLRYTALRGSAPSRASAGSTSAAPRVIAPGPSIRSYRIVGGHVPQLRRVLDVLGRAGENESSHALPSFRVSGRPARMLEHDAIPVGVLERPAFLVPVRIERLDRLVAQLLQPRHRSLPLSRVRQVEYEQVILARSPSRLVPRLVNERQMVRGLPVAEYHRVEPVVVPELVEHLESQAVTVELEIGGRVI